MRTTTVTGRSFKLPALKIADGTLAALKWLALCLMVGDHINKYLFNEKLPYLFELGRLAAPVFGFVLAYNLARAGALKTGAYARTVKRLLLTGAVTTPMFIGLGGLIGGSYPLNIMFMLATAAAAMWLLDAGRAGAAVLVVVTGGALVEFWWPAIVFCLAAWSYCRAPNLPALAAGVASCALLALINGNHWALAALPLIYITSLVQMDAPRARLFFYGFYPLHLGVVWLVKLALEPPI